MVSRLSRKAGGQLSLGPTAHVDTFTRDHLPPAHQWPDLLLDRPEFQYPEYVNAAVELPNGWWRKGSAIMLRHRNGRRTYKE
jgi:2-aminobenzoate-CoA ligase